MIDAKGKHVTPGIIDCHSHTGISGGVNEGTQACTAEVRIEDVTNPDAINWYRQLAGGVTAVNNLHGSANPIGGQNCVNKNRWGALHPDDMHFEGAKAGIKFALGENVKQSNWDLTERTRYPQTRMGVESIIRDRFTAARDYAKQWSHYPYGEIAKRNGVNGANGANGAAASNGRGEAPARRDIELEALAEILAGDRLIHCHSYRQDEILMLARLAQEFGFRIGTYQHNLEGYKVAEAVRDSAIGASLFSDWWNYKVEVQDAIPQAGPIMWEVGNVVSYNSDSDELARRMNVEAGKAVKYGGLKPEEALKFVTLNPAIQLAVEKRAGSLEAGKDADVVIWSGPPLSAMSRAEMTFVDGRCLFSLEQDAKHRETIAKERQRLIQKLLAQSGERPSMGGEGGGPPGGMGRRRPTDEDPRLDYYRARVREHYLDMLRRGIDPEQHKCGDCGVGELELLGAR
jgi:N-acetylglucosamine-6-phosphate deacetylase